MNDNDGLLMRTPGYRTQESPLHYFLRLSEANGYETPAVILQLVTRGVDWRTTVNWDCAHLNAVLPACRQVSANFTYRWPTSDHKCDLSLLGKFVLCKHLDVRHAGICPDCINELGYVTAWWGLKYAIACPAHHRMLLQSCPGCSKRISYLRRGLLRCSCGASLKNESQEKPSIELSWLMSLLQHKVEVNERPGAAKAARALKPEDLSLNTLCGVIDAVGKIERSMAGYHHARSSLGALHNWLPSVACFLYDWPNGVHAFCARWYDFVNAKGDGHRSFRSVFDWAYRGVIDRRTEHETDMLFIIDAVLQCAPKVQHGSPVEVRAKHLKQFTLKDAPYCSLNKASELSGIRLHTLVRLARANQISCRIVRRSGRPRYEIETEIARNLHLDYHAAISIYEGSKYLGFTTKLYRDLRRTGVIKKVHQTVNPHAIAFRDLEDYKQMALARAKVMANLKGMRSLDQLRRKIFPRVAMVQIVKGILDGSVPCFRPKTQVLRLDELYLRTEDIDAIIIKHTPKARISAKQLHSHYGLSYNEIHALRNYLGVVPNGKTTSLPNCLNREILNEFMSRYTGLTAYLRQNGTSRRLMLSRLRKAKVKVLKLTHPWVRGRVLYFIPLK